MKRDIKLNIFELGEVYKGIDRAKSALEEIAAASEQFQTVIREQDSAAYDELSRLWEEKVQKEERELAGKLGCIAEMVQGYIWDMTAYVEPENEGEMMRVDRNDIWWNYTQIRGNATGFLDILGDTGSSWQDYKKFYMYNPFLSAAENAERKAALEEEEREERERRERNYNTLAEFRKTLMGKITDELPGHIKKIHAIYEKNIVPFENTDDAYKKQIAEYYDQWASIGNKAEDVGNIAVDILSGVVDGLKDMVTGIAGLLEGACKLVEWGGRKLTGLTVPEELDEDVSNIFLCAETIIKDPGNALEAMGQHMFDVADEKGLAYSVSYVTADVVAGILLDKGIGKLKELRKAKKLNKIDDVLDTAEDLTGVGNNGTSLVDDVVESGKTTISSADRIKIDAWDYTPSDELYSKYKNVFDNPKYYNQKTGAINWPKNDGFASTPIDEVLQPGTRIDRYGSDFGSFTSPEGIPYEMRAVAPGTDLKPYSVFEVVEPINVKAGEIAPWFDEPGGGIQYLLPDTVDELLDAGILRRIK